MPHRATEYERLYYEALLNAVPSRTILNTLGEGLASISVLLLTADLHIAYANNVAQRILAPDSDEPILWRCLKDVSPTPWADERARLIQRTLDTRRTTIIPEIIEGHRFCSRLTPIQAVVESTPVPLVIWVLEQVGPAALDRIRTDTHPEDLFEPCCIDLGALNVLTDRELEVLAYIGQGLRPKQIAEQLCRATSTIDRHRERIGIKLGVHDRADLIRLANLAALEPEDAERKRVIINPNAEVHHASNPVEIQLGQIPIARIPKSSPNTTG